jgi:hypothetical protein
LALRLGGLCPVSGCAFLIYLRMLISDFLFWSIIVFFFCPWHLSYGSCA